MATRFYFTATAAPSITPAYDAEWNKYSNAVRRLLSRNKVSTINTTTSDSESSATSPYDILNRQLISKPLVAQTISGKVKGQMRCSESNADAEYCRALVIKVVSSDGSTVRGTLLSHFPASVTSEFGTSLTNRNFPPETDLNSVDAQDGDYLVVELGARAHNSSATAYTFYMAIRDTSGVNDLPEDETSTDNLCPWIEFSQDLLFQDKLEVYQAIAQVEYDDPAKTQVFQVVAQVEYDENPTVTGNVQVGLSPSSTVELTFGSVEVAGNVTISLTPASTVAADLGFAEVVGNIPISLSVTSDMMFEVAHYDGDIALAIGVGSEVIFDDGLLTHEITGTVTINLGVSGNCLVTIPGEYVFDLDGGVAVAGDLKFRHEEAGTTLVEFDGGVSVGGDLAIDVPEIATYEHELGGGIRVGGEPEYQFFDPSTLAQVVLLLAGGVSIGGSLTSTAEYVGEDDLVCEITLSGGVAVGELRLPPVEITAPVASEADILARVLRGGVLVDGALEFVLDEPEAYEHTTRFGGVRVGGGCVFATLTPPTLALELAGGMSIGGTVFEEGEPVETWALSGYVFSPSMYSGYPFNSYAEHRNQAFAAGEDGIYLLEGDDDDGQEFHAGVRIGPTNFGANNLKRLRGVYPGVSGGAPELRVKGEQNQQEGFYQLSRRDRFDCDRGVQDRVMTLDMQDFDVLSHIEITPLVLMRR